LNYSRFDGSQQFVPLSADNAFDKLSEYLMEHGDYVLRQLERLDKDDAGVENAHARKATSKSDEKGQYAVSPKGVKRIEEKALNELFQISNRGTLGKHETDLKGTGQVVHEDSSPTSLATGREPELHETLKNAIVRQGAQRPLHITEDDFVVYETEYQTTCATALLLDMSGSMARYGKFYHAKKVALAMQALIPRPLPAGHAEDYRLLHLRLALDGADVDPGGAEAGEHFRQPGIPAGEPRQAAGVRAGAFHQHPGGLKFARQYLLRTPAANKQILCVTDGEPTAHLEGRDLLLMYPPHERTARATLEEVRRCTGAGIRLSTLALIEDYYYLGLMNFVDQMARLSRGTAVYCTAGQLGSYVLDRFVNGRRSRKHVG